MTHYISALALLFSSLACFTQESGKDLLQKSILKVPGENIKLMLEQSTIDKNGRIKERTFEVLMGTIDKVKYTKMTMQKPERAAGVIVILSEFPDREGEIDIFTPANGKTRKMAATEQNMAMTGSDFSISQFTNTSVNDLNVKIIKEDVLNEVPVYLLEVKDKNAQTGAKAMLTIEKLSHHISRIDTYNDKAELISTTLLSDYQVVKNSDKVYPRMITTNNLQNKNSIKIKVLDVVPQENLNKVDFSLSSVN